MAKVRFYARGDQLVAVPEQIPMVGSPRLYVGREFLRATQDSRGKVLKPAAYPAAKSAHEFDSDTLTGSLVVDEVRRSHRQGCQSLWCADEETAAICGVPFVPVGLQAGSWVPKATEDDAGDNTPERTRKTGARK